MAVLEIAMPQIHRKPPGIKGMHHYIWPLLFVVGFWFFCFFEPGFFAAEVGLKLIMHPKLALNSAFHYISF